MKRRSGQVSSSRSREGRREATSRANRIKASTNLTDYPAFGQGYGEWGQFVTGYFTYTHLGIEIKLRFSQISWEWTARADHLKIEKSFPHQSSQTLQNELNQWIADHSLRLTTSPAALLRQSTPSQLADEVMLERGQ